MKMKLLSTLVAILLTTYCFAQYPPEFKGSNYGNNPKAGHYADIRGFKMYYEIYGKGEPMLFIHGNGGSINNFTGQIPFFAKNYQVIMVDSRGARKICGYRRFIEL